MSLCNPARFVIRNPSLTFPSTVAVREAMAFSFAPFTKRSKEVPKRSKQNGDDFSPVAAQLHEILIAPACCLEKEPGPSLRFVGPNFDQARGRNVAMFVTNVVSFTKARGQRSIVLRELGDHVQMLHLPGIGIEHA